MIEADDSFALDSTSCRGVFVIPIQIGVSERPVSTFDPSPVFPSLSFRIIRFPYSRKGPRSYLNSDLGTR